MGTTTRTHTMTFTFEERLYGTLEAARDRLISSPSREASLVVTKLEEAAQWNDAVREKKKLPPLGLGWKP